MNRSLITVAVAATLAATLAAQVKRPLPASAPLRDGNSLSNAPFHHTRCRYQHLVPSDALTKLSVSVVRGLAMRRETGGTLGGYAIKARRVPRLRIVLGHSKKTEANLDRVFANNWSDAPRTLFDKQVDLPAQPKLRGPAPFNVRFVLTSPFIHRKQTGNLLLEIICDDPTTTRYSGYWVDAAEVKSYGRFWIKGTSGRTASGRRPLLSLDTTQRNVQVPGGRLHYAVRYLDKSYPALWWIGFSDKSWGALTLPFDLSPFGASGNKIYTGLDLAGPMQLVKSGNYWSAKGVLPIPKDDALGGMGFFIQAMLADPAANNMGWVFTNMMETELGGGRVFAQSQWSTDLKATSARYARSSRSPGGVVIQWEGVL